MLLYFEENLYLGLVLEKNSVSQTFLVSCKRLEEDTIQKEKGEGSFKVDSMLGIQNLLVTVIKG